MDTVFSTQAPCITAAKWAQIQSHLGSSLRQRQGSQCLLSALRCLSQPLLHMWWEVRGWTLWDGTKAPLVWGGPTGIRGKDILFGGCSRHSRERALLNSLHITSFIGKTGIMILYMTGLLVKCETICKELALHKQVLLSKMIHLRIKNTWMLFPVELHCCYCLVAKSCPLFAAPWSITRQAPLSMGFPTQEYWRGLLFPSPGDLLDCEVEPASPASPPSAGTFFTTEPPVQFSSVAQSCPTLCDPMNCGTPGLPVHHQLPEFTQTHVHRVGDAIQPSHPLSSPSPPAFKLSQHQSLFKWVSSSHQVAKVLEFQLQHQSFQWIFRTDLL